MSVAGDIHEPTKNWIRRWCRKLKPDDVDWDAASIPAKSYNCMGYAVGVLKWWQSWTVQDGVVLNPDAHWHRSLPVNDDSVDAYIRAAQTQGFEVCAGPEPEDGFEKIVLYYTPGDERPFRHAAKVLAPELWDSKVGEYSDFTHARDAFDDVLYWNDGRVFMRRPVKTQ